MTERSAPTSSVKIAKPTSMLSNLFSAASLEKFARELKPEEFIVKKRVREEIPEIAETGSKENEEKEKGPKKREGKKKKWDEARRIEVDALKASGEWKKICDANNAAAVSNSQGKDVDVPDKKPSKAVATDKKVTKTDAPVVKHSKSAEKADTVVDNSNESDPTDDANAESLGPIVTDGSRDAFTVFLGNVPKAETAKTLKKYCSQFGEVESVRLRSIPVAGTAVDDAGNQKLVRRVCAISRNFADVKGSFNAYVVFKTKEAVEGNLLFI
jgi:nucleolar protein 12